jgi:hypothetical protein
LTRRIDEFLPDPLGKLDRRNKVAYAETKAHCDIELLILLRERLKDGKPLYL